MPKVESPQDVLASPASELSAEDPSALALVNVLLRARRNIALAAMSLGLVALVATLVPARKWGSESSFMPQSRRAQSNLSGLAAQFGLSVPGAEATQSPAFYADLATSRELLSAVVDSRYRYPGDTGTVEGTLVEIFDVRGRTPALRREAALKLLQKRVSASPNAKTGVVRLSIVAHDPELARQINARLLSLLDEFNRERRQSQASAERKFSETRTADARERLRESEERLQAFLQRNRDYRNSPELNFQQERLAREVQMRQQIYTTLVQAFEQAKLEEVRDTPVLTIVEAPTLAVKPQPRGLALRVLVALVVGAGMAGLWAILVIGVQQQRRAGDADVAEFDRLRAATARDVRNALRLRRPPSTSDQD